MFCIAVNTAHAQIAAKGLYLLEESGNVNFLGDIANIYSPYYREPTTQEPWFAGSDDAFKRIQVYADSSGEVVGYYLLGYEGSVFPVTSTVDIPTWTKVPGVSPPYFGWDIAGDLEPAIGWNGATNEMVGMYIMDRFGGIHLWGNTTEYGDYFKAYQNYPGSYMPWTYFGWDIARDLETSYCWDYDAVGETWFARLNGYYILDGFGGVHANIENAAGDNVPAPWDGQSLPYFGWDIATDLELLPSGDGFVMLDAYGAIHFAPTDVTSTWSTEFAANADVVWDDSRTGPPPDNSPITNLYLGIPADMGIDAVDIELVANETFYGYYVVTNLGEVYSQPRNADGDMVYPEIVPDLGPGISTMRKVRDIELNPVFRTVTGVPAVDAPRYK